MISVMNIPRFFFLNGTFITESFLLTSESIARFDSLIDVQFGCRRSGCVYFVCGGCAYSVLSVLLTCAADSMWLLVCVSMRGTVCT